MGTLSGSVPSRICGERWARASLGSSTNPSDWEGSAITDENKAAVIALHHVGPPIAALGVYFMASHRYSVGLEILRVLQMSAMGRFLSACIFLAV